MLIYIICITSKKAIIIENLEVHGMENEKSDITGKKESEYYGAGYSVFFREDKLLSYSEIYNWWKMKKIISQMIHEEGFNKNKEYIILDMGCSRGNDIFRINREFNGYKLRFVGYDIIAQDIEYAESVARQNGIKNVSFKVTNAERPGFEDKTFDVITCSEVMEHQKKPKQVLRECHRILKPNGIIIITTPNMEYNDVLPKRLRRRLKSKVRSSVKSDITEDHDKLQPSMPYSDHVFVVNVDNWVKMLNEIGFSIESLKRGSLVYGGPFFDNNVKLTGLLLIFDNILDHLTYGYSWNIIIKARKKDK
jgi:ubiquinone/menaquinone biosynthesis C-methylase UbiE